MNIIYSKNYKVSNTKWISLHHVGGLVNDPYLSTQHLTAEQINQDHKNKWNFIDPYTGKYGGYNFYYEKDGKRTQFRTIGAETAANKNYNFDGLVISHCFAGNFSTGRLGIAIDIPTPAQEESYRQTLKELKESGVKVVLDNFKPHRFFNPTNCYGNYLDDDYIKTISKGYESEDERILIQKLIESIQLLILELQKKINFLKLGGVAPCDEFMKN